MSSVPLRLRVLERAQRYVGVGETPPGSNRGSLIDGWNRLAGVPLGSPYCASFGHAMYHAEGYELGGAAYCPAVLSWGRGKGFEVRRPLRGDISLYDWDQDGTVDHFGIVEKVLALRWRGGRFVGLLRTVEANTSASLRGSPSNGDGVHRRWRWVNSSTRFLRVKA